MNATVNISMQSNWQQALQDSVTTLDELLALLALSRSALKAACLVDPHFKLRVPRSFVARMTPGDPEDPLLQQVLPLQAELQKVVGYTHDPLQEHAANPHPGLLHKYHGRVLLTMAGQCAINCRYCFRRHFPYAANQLGRSQWPTLLNYLKQQQIHEVILSGGEPLLLKDDYLLDFIAALETVTSLKTLRFHTRLPVVIPERITPKLVEGLQTMRLRGVMVMHCNHPNEINAAVRAYWARLRTPNLHLLNQAVLLKGVNDESATLVALQNTLFSAGVLPYYLHQLDPVAGAAHFAVPIHQAKALEADLRAQLPGYLVPRFVSEQAGALAKVPL